MYMSPDMFLVKYVSVGGMGPLDSDGRKNVRNFNISPLRCTRHPSTDSNTNKKLLRMQIWIFLEIIIPYFVTAGTTEWRLLTYSGTLLLTNQFLTWKRNTNTEVNGNGCKKTQKYKIDLQMRIGELIKNWIFYTRKSLHYKILHSSFLLAFALSQNGRIAV